MRESDKISSNRSSLGDICQVFPGVTARYLKQIDGIDGSNALALRGKDFTSLGEFNVEEMEPVLVDVGKSSVQRCLLQEGDVVLLARGSAIRAGYVPADVAVSNIIASANFILIRPDREKVLGEVITAYINSFQGREALLKLSGGTAVQQVPASALRRFNMPVPIIKNQQIVAEIHRVSISAYLETLALADQQRHAANAAIVSLLQEVG